jgi:hypothetical protein
VAATFFGYVLQNKYSNKSSAFFYVNISGADIGDIIIVPGTEIRTTTALILLLY